MAMLTVPTTFSAYVKNCIPETERSVYGRDNRQPIHDAINYASGMAQVINEWCIGIGLCVQDGKLCVIYDGRGDLDG